MTEQTVRVARSGPAAEFARGRGALAEEAGPGAARFAAGAGRHGSFGS